MVIIAILETQKSMLQHRFVFNKRFEYNVDILPSKIAIWEAYKPFLKGSGIFSVYEKKSFISTSSSLSSRIRLEALYNNLSQTISRYKAASKRAEPNEFRVAELGGGTFITTRLISIIIEKANLSFKSFDVYDTFKGLPKSKYQPELDDLEGLFHGSLDKFHEKLSEFAFAKPIPGLVPSSLPEDDASQYDFVHIDLDLYEGTLGGLNHFFPRMKKLGIIQLDDYNSNPWDGVNDAVDEFLSCQNGDDYFFQAIPLGGAYIVKI